MNLKDYTVLNRRTTEQGCLVGFGTGAVMAYGLHRLRPGISRNGLFLTFFATSTFFTFLSTNVLLSRRRSTILSKDASGGASDDPDFRSWKDAQGTGFEAGVGGMEALEDRYASTRGDH